MTRDACLEATIGRCACKVSRTNGTAEFDGLRVPFQEPLDGRNRLSLPTFPVIEHRELRIGPAERGIQIDGTQQFAFRLLEIARPLQCSASSP